MLAPLICRDMVDRAPYQERRVVRLNYRLIRAKRREFNEAKRDEFRRYYTGHDKPHGIEIHHILPVALGGGNEWQNLCLIDPELHKAVHEYIDEQLEGLQAGGVACVRIPIISRNKFWGLHR